MVQLSHPYMTSGKIIALTRWTFVGKVMSLLFNMLFICYFYLIWFLSDTINAPYYVSLYIPIHFVKILHETPLSGTCVVSVASTVVKGAWNRGASLGSSCRSLGVRWPHGNAGTVYWILPLCQSLSVFHLILILITALRGASCPGSLMRKWGPGFRDSPHTT